MMDVAYHMSKDAHGVSQVDIQKLHDDGFPDEQILDIVTAAAARNFFSRTLHALGVEPDASFRESDPELFNFVINSEYKNVIQ